VKGPVLCAIVAATTSHLAIADAPDKDAGKRAFAEGQALYARGDYGAAGARFEAAYAADPDPAYIFNAGQAYRLRAAERAATQRSDCAAAMKAYREFLRAMPSSFDRAEVDRYVADMKACAGELVVASTDKPVDTPIDRPIDRAVEPPPSEPHPSDIRYGTSPLRIGSYLVGGIGLVGIGLGTHYALEGRRLADERDRSTSGSERARLDDEGHAANVKMAVAMSIGGAAVITGVVMWIKGGRPRESRISVAPARRGASVIVRF